MNSGRTRRVSHLADSSAREALFFVSKFNAVIFHSQSLIRDFMLSEYEVDLCIRHLESTERLRHAPLTLLWMSGWMNLILPKRRREWGLQFKCSPKAHLSELSVHWNRRRVWGCGSLRSGEKDLCESPRIQCDFKGACRKSVEFLNLLYLLLMQHHQFCIFIQK